MGKPLAGKGTPAERAQGHALDTLALSVDEHYSLRAVHRLLNRNRNLNH